MTREEVDAHLRAGGQLPEGLTNSAWEPLQAWTGEGLRAINETISVDEAMADDPAHREAWIGELDQHFDDMGVRAEHTVGGIVDLLVACGVLQEDDGGCLSLNPSAPLPAEVLVLEPEEAALQDRMRWESAHQESAQAIIALFEPGGERISVLQTTGVMQPRVTVVV